MRELLAMWLCGLLVCSTVLAAARMCDFEGLLSMAAARVAPFRAEENYRSSPRAS